MADDILWKKIDDAIAYLSKIDLSDVPLGRYYINENSYYVVQEYATQERCFCRAELHREHADVQWIINGEEEIDTVFVSDVEKDGEYDSDKDVLFVKNREISERVILRNNSYVIIPPNVVHIPGVMISEPKVVKKAVIKIKIT